MGYFKHFLKLLGGISFAFVLLMAYVIAPGIVLTIILVNVAKSQGADPEPVLAQLESIVSSGTLAITAVFVVVAALLIAIFRPKS